MSIANANIMIGNNSYPLIQLRGKTLYATKKLPLYASYKKGAAIRSNINAGDYIGIVQGFVANGYKGAAQSFFIIGNSTTDPNTRFVPYSQFNFSESKLKGQGTKTGEDIQKDIENEGQPFYIKIIKQIAPWAVGGSLAYLLLKNKLN